MMNLLLSFLICLSQAQEASVQVYDVTDILRPPSAAPTTTVTVAGRKGSQVVTQEVSPAAPSAEAPTAEQLQQHLLAATGHLCDRIRALIDPPLVSGESLQASAAGQLLLYAGPERQTWLRELLKRNRPQEQVLFVQSHWIEGPKGAFAGMGIASGGAATVLAAKDGERFLALGKDSSGFSVRSAPRMLVKPLVASSSIMVGRVLSYVKEWKLVTVQPGDARIADPEIGTVDVGFSMQVQGVLLDGGKVALELDTTNTSVAEPIPTKSVTLDPASKQELTIGVPVVDTKSIHAKCTLSSEGLIAFCSPVAGHDDRELLILVRAQAQSVAELKAGASETTISGGKKKPAEAPK